MPLPLYLLNNDVGSGHRSTSLTPITSAMLCYVIDTRNRFVRYLAVPEDNVFVYKLWYTVLFRSLESGRIIFVYLTVLYYYSNGDSISRGVYIIYLRRLMPAVLSA